MSFHTVYMDEASIPWGDNNPFAIRRLVSAAPDLYLACHHALMVLDDPATLHPDNLEVAREILRDALNRADGGMNDKSRTASNPNCPQHPSDLSC